MVSEKLCVDKLDVITIKEILLVMNGALAQIGMRQVSIMRNQCELRDRLETIEELLFDDIEDDEPDSEESSKCSCKHERNEEDVCDDLLVAIQRMKEIYAIERKGCK